MRAPIFSIATISAALGGSLASETVSTRPIRTAPAVYPAADGVFVAFQGRVRIARPPRRDNNLTVLQIRAGSPPSLATAWCGAFRGEGSPIVTTTDGRSNPIVWILGAEGDGRLHGTAATPVSRCLPAADRATR